MKQNSPLLATMHCYRLTWLARIPLSVTEVLSLHMNLIKGHTRNISTTLFKIGKTDTFG